MNALRTKQSKFADGLALPVKVLQKSISRTRDITSQNEIFKSNEMLEVSEEIEKSLITSQQRVKMGIFGDFNVTVSQPSITENKPSKTTQFLDRSSMISIKDNMDVVSPTIDNSRRVNLATSIETSLN